MNFERAGDYRDAEKYLESFMNYEKMVSYRTADFDLGRIRNFLAEYGVDYGRLKYVHVAGSKGKGSVANLIGNYLWRDGFKVGIFTSPHILKINERFWLNGFPISDDEFVAMVEDLRGFLVERGGECELTYFELLTVMGLKLFVDNGVDYAVLEVGLGGRLDATNIVDPALAVITPVEMEHVGILGNNLAEILTEKLGIVKDGRPALIAKQSAEADAEIRVQLEGRFGVDFGRNVRFVNDFKLPDFPLFRDRAAVENGRTVFCALKMLLGDVDERLLFDVLDKTRLLGRFDLRGIDGKKVIFDMAHTLNSMENLVDAIPALKAEKVVFLVSILKGKDVEGMLKLIRGVADEVIFTSCHEERGFTGKELAAMYAGKSEVDEHPNKAYEGLFKAMKKNQLLVITGSHFLVSKVLSEDKFFL